MRLKQNQKEGISLRTIHIALIVGAVIISCMMLYSTYHLSSSFQRLTETSEQQIELRKAARELMDASDYLTEKVQRFTVQGDMSFLHEYFKEAFEENHREEALRTMSEYSGSTVAMEKLQYAMDYSKELMKQEYYAMRLVVEAKGELTYPDVLKSVVLTEEDQALSSEEKMRLATQLVLSDDYYELKNKIRENMQASLDELERMVYHANESALHSLREELAAVRTVIILQTIAIFILVWLTSKLGIRPVLHAVERIREDSPIPEEGANEFRYLARAYNKMYETYKNSLERLNFKASHDELTGAYNRSGYELLLSSIDLNSTYMMLFDLDNFKNINDTYGHETGDRVLMKMVRVLKSNFRSDDYVCRVGGDEFVVFMAHATEMQHDLIVSKIEKINSELADTGDGLPAISASVGVAHGSKVGNAEHLFEKTDEAMYHSKQNGKHTYTFSFG